MATNTYKSLKFDHLFSPLRINRSIAFGMIILTALVAFEIFNYGTTEYALTDLLGNLRFIGIRWATILSIAFCGIDFAGIARLFSPDQGRRESQEVWYLFGAWLLAASMNAMLTWWGVSLAILNNQPLGNEVIARETLLRIVPIFIAILIWLIRVLVIGTISASGDKLFRMQDNRFKTASQPTTRFSSPSQTQMRGNYSSTNSANLPRAASSATPPRHPAPLQSRPPEPEYSQPELTYHPVSMNANSSSMSGSQKSNIGYPKPVSTSTNHFS